MESTERKEKKFSPHHFTLTIETYKSLKQEIFVRGNNQMQCVINSINTIAVIVAAIITADYITNNSNKFTFLLLIIPWLLSIYGITWCDHHKHIQLMGKYIRQIEEKIVADADFLKGWEDYLDTRKKPIKNLKKLPLLNVIFPVFYFFIPSLISLVFFISLQSNSLVNLQPETTFYY